MSLDTVIFHAEQFFILLLEYRPSYKLGVLSERIVRFFSYIRIFNLLKNKFEMSPRRN